MTTPITLAAQARTWARVSPPFDSARAAGITGLPQETQSVRTSVIPLPDVDGWSEDERWGELHHRTGRFFRITGVSVQAPAHGMHWSQPIIDQGDVGILGVLTRQDSGGTEVLVQGKAEPGNAHGVQLAPTVQATSSNYERAHGGRHVPYLDLFLGDHPGITRILDVGQSEHGHRFFRKSNRNVVLSTDRPVELEEGFRWMPVADLLTAMHVDDLVGMDLRSVMSCLFARQWQHSAAHSVATDRGADVAAMLSARRRSTQIVVSRQALHDLPGWARLDGGILPTALGTFSVVGLQVTAHGREVAEWCQPALRSLEPGLTVLFARRGRRETEILLRFSTEPGLRDKVELGPSVQISPAGTATRACSAAHLEVLLDHGDREILYDRWLSDEGGRFLDSLVRHLVVEVDSVPESSDSAWLPLSALDGFVRAGHDVSMELRSAMCCLAATGLGQQEERSA